MLDLTPDDIAYIVDTLNAQAYVYQQREAQRSEGYDGDTANRLLALAKKLQS